MVHEIRGTCGLINPSCKSISLICIHTNNYIQSMPKTHTNILLSLHVVFSVIVYLNSLGEPGDKATN